jgi:NAD(P)H-nitrite reductase large subunit
MNHCQEKGVNLMEEDILEKGAILQRDKETFSVAPHIPGGFIRVADFRRLLDTAE